ncbi:MAG: hypothetical protein SGARI_002588, partial [Bacillariaceae sp.]
MGPRAGAGRGREIDPLLVKDARTANIMMVQTAKSTSSVDDKKCFCFPPLRGRSAITTVAM